MSEYSRYSMRSLRTSLATDLLSSKEGRFSQKSKDAVGGAGPTLYNAVPKRRLQLADVKIEKRLVKLKETNKERKKRRWQEIQEMKRLSRSGEEVGADGAAVNYKKRKFEGWAFLPDIVLEEIFKYLSYRDKLYAAMTCTQWSQILCISSIYSNLTVTGTSMSVWRYNIGTRDYQPVLDTTRVSYALNAIGHKLKSLSFLPKENLHNIVEFQIVINRFCQINRTKLPNIKSFSYVFPCDFARKHNEVDIYGTGGMILQNMKQLLECLPGLERLELIDLQLVGDDAEHVLDEVGEVCRLSLKHLTIVNISRLPLSMMAVGSFVNMRILVVSPHNMGDDLIETVAHMPKLRHLHIMTNKYTQCTPTPVDYRIWRYCRKHNPRLRVHLVTEGLHKEEFTFQTSAPVKSLVYRTPYTRISQASINLVVELYRTDLEVYAHEWLPRFSRSRSFHERADSSYLYLLRECPYIHTLMIRERVSSSTVLLLAYTGKNLRYLYVRRNAIILKCDWPKNPEWSEEFYRWLKASSKSYEDMEREVSQILGFRWFALNDKQFKLTSINLNYQHYYEGFEEV